MFFFCRCVTSGLVWCMNITPLKEESYMNAITRFVSKQLIITGDKYLEPVSLFPAMSGNEKRNKEMVNFYGRSNVFFVNSTLKSNFN